MHHIHFHYHTVEYLASTVAQNDNTGEEAVVLTVRSSPGDWQPCNLGFTRPQAERLLQDLHRLLVVTPLLLVLIAGTGCSARVDVATERSTGGESAAVEKFHTKVAVELLTDQEQAPQPTLAADEPSAPTKAEERRVVANYAIIVEGDLHIHEHYHLHLEDRPAEENPKPVEVHKPKLDPECERLTREHEERVKEWEAMMNR